MYDGKINSYYPVRMRKGVKYRNRRCRRQHKNRQIQNLVACCQSCLIYVLSMDMFELPVAISTCTWDTRSLLLLARFL